MNWQLLIPLLVTTLVAVAGWMAAHRFNSQRDLRSKRREIRVDYLIRAYQRLEAGACREALDASNDRRDFESAVADIQLFGTNDQVRMAKEMAAAIAERRIDASAGPLLLSLRDALRRELDLGEINEQPFFFRLIVGEKPTGQNPSKPGKF